MAVFEPIELEWQGEKFSVPSDKVMGAIARIEDIITLPELQNYYEKGGMPLGKLSMAYAAVLRYAGAKASDDEVYNGIFTSEQSQDSILEAIMNLMMLMIPPDALEDEQKEIPLSEAGKKKSSSNKPSKHASAKAG